MEFEPIARRGCVSASINSRAYVWGGETDYLSTDASHLMDINILDTRTERWQTRPINGQHPPGFKFCAFAQADNLLYIYGGYDEQNQLTGALYCMDLDDFSSKEVAPPSSNSPKKLGGSGMVVRDNKIYLFGGYTTGRFNTNELHVYDLSKGSWSSPVTTGDAPPECSDFSFTEVNKNTVALFGGDFDAGTSGRLYLLDLNSMHWREIPCKSGEPWPEKRAGHTGCCIGMDTSHSSLIVCGGEDNYNYFDDIWLLDIISMIWKKMTTNLYTKSSQHNTGVIEVSENVSEIAIFGGWNRRDRRLSLTTIIRIEKEEETLAISSSATQWRITDIASSTELGTGKRLQYQKTLYENEFKRACRRVIKEQLSVLIHIARLNFVGLPRSGKSTTLKRLIGEILNILSANLVKEPASTGVAERSQVIIKSISRSICFTLDSNWSSEDLLGEAGIINQFIQTITKDATKSQPNLQKISQENQSSDRAQVVSGEVKSTQSKVRKELPSTLDEDRATSQRGTTTLAGVVDLSIFQDAISKGDWGTVKYLLEDTIYLINTDTGGQTEFLDLMSRFLMGPAMNLIISRLVDSFEKVYQIYCVNDEGVSTAIEDSVVTLEEVIFQSLASIACMDASYESETSEESHENEIVNIKIPPCSSKAMFVGTFRDKVTQGDFENKDMLLKKKIEQTEFHRKGLILHASENNLMLTLDNLKGGKKEINEFRDNLEKKIRRNFKKVNIPVTWLMLSVKIRERDERTITLKECQDMAGKLGITPADLPKALWFLHYRVGILHYYPEIEGFSQLIICDVMIIFDATTQLVKKTFTFKNVEKHVVEDFKERAQFTMDDLQQATENSIGDPIPLKKLVLLLEYHKILAALPPCEGREITYFMPCVLKSATGAELSDIQISPDVSPLMIRYECGYLPLGVFSSLIIELVSNYHSDWRLVEDNPCRNKIEFQVGDKYDTVTLVCRPTFMEVSVFRSSGIVGAISSVCMGVLSTLKAALGDVHSQLKYHSTARFQYAFECPLHPGKKHLCVLPKPTVKILLCLANIKKPVTLCMDDKKQLVWFCPLQGDLDPSLWNSKITHMNYFSLIRYYENAGVKKELRILDDLAADWESIAITLGFESSDIKTIQNSGSGKTPDQCLRDVLTRWLQNADNMPRQERFPCTWTGVYNFLVDSKHGTAAGNLKAAIEASHSDLHNNLDDATEAPRERVSQVISASAKIPLQQPQHTHQQKAPLKDIKSAPRERASPATLAPAADPLQHPHQEAVSQSQESKKSRKRKRMNKHDLAKWLENQGVDDDDVQFLKSEGMTEILFLKMEPGNKRTERINHLSPATIEMLPHLQDELRKLQELP